MADLTAHVGEKGTVEVEIHDAAGNPTTNWDVAGGVQWSSTNETAVAVTDTDANPQDGEVDFLALTDSDVFLECSFDGKIGPDENRITLRSQSISVEPGEAAGGTVTVRMVQV